VYFIHSTLTASSGRAASVHAGVFGARAGYAGLFGMSAQGLDVKASAQVGYGSQFGAIDMQACLAMAIPAGKQQSNQNQSVTALPSERQQYRKHPAFYRKSRRKSTSD